MTPHPDALRLNSSRLSAALEDGRKRPRRPKRGTEFLSGPIPLEWLRRAAVLPGKALAVAVLLWFRVNTRKCRQVKLTGELRERFNIHRKAGARALDALERAGLVDVDRHVGRAPVVTMKDLAAEPATKGSG